MKATARQKELYKEYLKKIKARKGAEAVDAQLKRIFTRKVEA